MQSADSSPSTMVDARPAAEEAADRVKTLIVIDIDQVLAMYRGGDCQTGLPIYRTFKESPRPVQSLGRSCVDVAIVTHRVRAEAECILEAVGLTAWARHVVTANDLFRESVKLMLRERRMDGLSKGVAAGALRRRVGVYDPTRSVMIDNQFSNLDRMIRSGVVGFGLLTPQISCEDGGRIRAFDLHKVLDMAAALAGPPSSAMAIRRPASGAGSTLLCEEPESGWQNITGPTDSSSSAQGPVPVAPGIFACPLMDEVWTDSDLDTGWTLVGNRFDPVTILRTLKRRLANVKM